MQVMLNDTVALVILNGTPCVILNGTQWSACAGRSEESQS